jgi:hypothetical protein
MLRSCSERLRSYPGRPVRQAVAVTKAPCVATYKVIGQESAEAIVGEDVTIRWYGNWKRARRTEKPGWSHPAEGPNP